MRQKVQTPEDAKLRKALENMRYKTCTEDDIAFLTTRIAGQDPRSPSLSNPNFRDVSIITAWNSQKDRINELGASRFAEDTSQELVDFYSEDKWAVVDRSSSSNIGVKKSQMRVHKEDTITLEDQKVIWSLSPHTSNHFAACLRLCMGIPVMIRNNDATELCMTKGQEGNVVGWQCSVGSKGQRVLDTLFIELANPPSDVQLEGLPLNVVPIAKTSMTVPVRFQDDTIKHVVRQQVNVLLNFSMTDYTAQGKTRVYNVVDLQHCRNHQSYYTCLSRSASAEGTVIMQAFDQHKITGGASGWLRQEFRMLELLDEITLLKYENKLPSYVDGHRRNTLVERYQQWKGKNYVPPRVPSQIVWSSADPVVIDNALEKIDWKIVDRKKFKEDQVKSDLARFVPAKGTKPVEIKAISSGEKRKAESDSLVNDSKRVKICNFPNHLNELIGMKWDNLNYSCAYDALFTVLFHIWIGNPQKWNKDLKRFSLYSIELVKGFQKVYQGTASMEMGRDQVRRQLHSHNSNMFPYGQVGTSVSDIAHTIIGSTQDIPAWIRCPHCNAKVPMVGTFGHMYTPMVASTIATADWLANRWNSPTQSPSLCTACNNMVSGSWHCDSVPRLVILDVHGQSMTISHTLSIRGNIQNAKLHLRGIIYYKAFHFSAMIYDEHHIGRFHDGMVSASLQIQEFPLKGLGDLPLNKDGWEACQVIYARN
ncbi:hypothetical protein BJ138DRAFT_1016243 [Hygrophoropsis aurantiaca]|uniref:Uncharacterized protein n=1 Tax=Hygrophoropsis aurantiaca TaxID=72124 RepID=A0ACB7ZYT0_9AGAM|nr:hypothetical protein BJ138DRAFT_1016243 [Hygrophoropsis aurantiaca]